MKYGIAIFPSKKLQDFANSYRKRYDSHYALIPPHITLKGPFEENEVPIEKLAEKVREIVPRFNPFQIKITKFSSFKPVNNVVYLKIEPNKDIMALNETLNSLLGQYPEKYPFVPHITIAQDLSDDEHSDIYGSLRMQQVYFEETIDRFHLLYQLENGSWTVYETFLLRKDNHE